MNTVEKIGAAVYFVISIPSVIYCAGKLGTHLGNKALRYIKSRNRQ